MSFTAIVHVPNGLANLSGAKVIKAWHEDSETLAALEVTNVKARTPVDTGALQASVDATNNTGSGPVLAEVFFNEDNQLSAWDRVYAQYQEGPPLGLSTYTNDPHQMLYAAQSEDAPAIVAWAVMSGQRALDQLG